MPPSAITGTPLPLSARATLSMAMICGTPTPVTMRVVQIEPGPMPTLTASAPASASASAASPVAMLPPITSICGKCFLTQRTRSITPALWPCAVSTTSASTPAAASSFDALLGALADADGRADAQLAVLVARRARKVRLLGDVLDRHQAAQLEGVVDDQHALELVLVHQRLAVVDGRAFTHRDQALARRHDLAHGNVHARLEAQVAVGDDADHRCAVEHREARDAVLLRQRHHLAHRRVGADR